MLDVTVEVRAGRWQEVLVGTYDPARAVVITDPPYGLGVRDVERGYDDTQPWAEHVTEVLRLLPAVRHVIRGPATRLMQRDYPQPRRLCVEVALYRGSSPRPGIVPFRWQGWAVYGRLRLDKRSRHGDAAIIRLKTDAREAGAKMAHRAITPLEAAMWAVDTWGERGLLVVDPFAGLGTIGYAAVQLGLDYLGAEVDQAFAARALENIGRPQLRLAYGEG